MNDFDTIMVDGVQACMEVTHPTYGLLRSLGHVNNMTSGYYPPS